MTRYAALLIAFCTVFFTAQKLSAQSTPQCTTTDIPANLDPDDEYFKTIISGCRCLNAAVYDSAKYFFEMGLYFHNRAVLPRKKLAELQSFLGTEKFNALKGCKDCGVYDLTESTAQNKTETKTVPPPVQTPSSAGMQPNNATPQTAPSSTSQSQNIKLPDAASGTQTPAGNSQPIVISEPPDDDNAELDEATKQMLQEKSVDKCKQFTDYIKSVTDNSATQEMITSYIDGAVTLFVNERSTIEVSSRNRPDVKKYPVRRYLIQLSGLSSYYDKVEIKSSDVYFVNNIRKGPDGNYYGNVTFVQTFIGFKDNKIVYNDITKKDIVIVIRKLQKMTDGKTETVWDVFLKEVKVVETI